jgi:hypothetical protein
MKTLLVALALLALLVAVPAQAAILCDNLASGTNGSDTNATSYNTDSVTLPANNLVLLLVQSKTSSGTANTPTATSTGATWQAVNNQNDGATRKASVLRTLVGSNQTGAVTIDFGGQTQQNAHWVIVVCSGVDTTGTHGSGAVVTSNVATGASEGSDSYTHTCTAFSSSDNRPVVGVGTNASTSSTAESGWEELAENNSSDSGSSGGIAGTWRSDASDTSLTTDRAAAWTGYSICVEVKVAPAASQKFIGGGVGSTFIQ